MYLLTIIPLWIACGQATALLAYDIKIDLPQRIVTGIGCSFLVTLMLSAILLLFNFFSLATLLTFHIIYVVLTMASIYRYKFYSHIIKGETKTFFAMIVGITLFVIGIKAVYGFSLSEYMASYFTHGSFLLNTSLDYPFQNNYGNKYILPFLFLKHSLVFATMLLSGGDRFQYFFYGIPVLSTIISVFVSLGAYLFFRLFLSRPTALLIGAIFLYYSLNFKIIDVRADCIAWATAFPFLILFFKGLKNTKSKAIYYLVPGLFVTIVLLHGIVALIVLSMSIGMWVSKFIDSRRKEKIEITKWGAIMSALTILLTGSLYYSLHYKYTDRNNNSAFEIYDKNGPKIGEPDPGVEYINIILRKNYNASVKEPPYVTLKSNLKQAFINPIISPLTNCGKFFNRLLILFGVTSFILILFFDKTKKQIQPLLFGFGAVFLIILVYSIRLNYTSSSYFPWAIFPRRLANYQHAAMTVIYSIFIVKCIEMISNLYFPKLQSITSLSMILTGLIIFAFPSINMVNSPQNKSYTFTSQNFKELLKFLNENAKPGENAVANFRTVNYMTYLSSINFISEGRGPYQVYRLIKQNTKSLKDIRNFFIHPSIKFLNKYQIKYIVLSKGGMPPGDPSFIFPSFKVIQGLHIKYQNKAYIVLQVNT